jgi:hypothetical protein
MDNSMDKLSQFLFLILLIINGILRSEIASDFGRYIPKYLKITNAILGFEI